MNFMVGCNWDKRLITELVKRPLVTEVYGSIPSFNPIGTARPDFRLNDMKREEFFELCAILHKYGIEVNYTLNTSLIDPRAVDLHEIVKFLIMLEDHVDRVTIAHPLVGEWINEYTDLPIEISTIMQVRNAHQLELLKERMPTIDKICIDVFRNRDFKHLTDMKEICSTLNIIPELLVNEFCIHDCIDRNYCYDIHALNLEKENLKLFNTYPMGRCISKRTLSPIEWLKARFILPQNLCIYEELGFNNFKLSGRTHSTDYILKVLDWYISRQFNGNLLDLWAHLETIFKDKPFEQRTTIPVGVGTRIDEHFIDPWVMNQMKSDIIEEEYLTWCMEGPNV